MLSESLVLQLEAAVSNGTPERRLEMLRGVTDFFLGEAPRLSETQVAVFDDVLIHLIERIEVRALAQLSRSLAPVDNAPIEVVRRLSRDDEISVAGPVLRQSIRLTDDDLIDIARTKSQGHLLAMSERPSLREPVTDVLIDRGDRFVHRTLAVNVGAQFSEFGYESLVLKSQDDEVLSESLAKRGDLPVQLLPRLLDRATQSVRDRLGFGATPEKHEKIRREVASIAGDVMREATKPRDYTAAERLVDTLNRQGKLDEAVLTQFIKEGKHEEMTAALGLFSGAKCEVVERILNNVNAEGVVIVGKAAKLGWPTVQRILEKRFAHHAPSTKEIEDAKNAFLGLSESVAQRSMRFMQAQEAAKKIQHPAHATRM